MIYHMFADTVLFVKQKEAPKGQWVGSIGQLPAQGLVTEEKRPSSLQSIL